jgi:hypothetical protein
MEPTEERVFRFENEIYQAKIIVYQGKVTLAYLPFDERLPNRIKACASVEEALCDISNAGEHTGIFKLAMMYVTDHLE